MDINALQLLHKENENLKSLQTVSAVGTTFNKFNEKANKSLDNARDCIEKVSKYGSSISEEMRNFQIQLHKSSTALKDAIEKRIRQVKLEGNLKLE